ncbi:DegV family protein [Psychrobacillus psychrodurans]|uniref:DegV family protein n=1 Tax=Psychrobacillus psychrodurans TaxID=126157 RepID=UPI0008EAD0FF|nr:DegV family protein [Psychrobacillus psychrodurans]MCZ8539943.1 DegV family protein [Psychrobacillus psychrodurans]SFM53735.1 EDD domain protein, DegV family [Psychrobacillus psychrodurans]
MPKVHIVTDSTADLTTELIEQYNINVIPLTIQIDGESFIDGVDIKAEEFLEKMSIAKELPKSSQPSSGVFKELYDELGKDGDQVISIHMTGGMSGTVKSAQAAAEMTESDVTVIDSKFISFALSFQVEEAAKMASNGETKEAIIQKVEDIRQKTDLFVVVDTLDNLVKGGRIGKGKAMLGSLLSIKPIASLAGGEYTPIAKVRSHKQVVNYLFDRYIADTKGKVVKAVGISHANGFSMAKPLMNLIKESGFLDIQVSFTSPVISTHTGPGAIGFMYTTE